MKMPQASIDQRFKLSPSTCPRCTTTLYVACTRMKGSPQLLFCVHCYTYARLVANPKIPDKRHIAQIHAMRVHWIGKHAPYPTETNSLAIRSKDNDSQRDPHSPLPQNLLHFD